MLKFDFENSVGYWLILATRDMRRALESELVAQDITLRQWEVLAWLSIEERMTQSELAERLGVEAPTLAGILDRMERDGWVERYGCPHDRRKKRLQATSKADAIWNRTVECAHRVRARATQGISPEELSQLKYLCQKIRTNLEMDPIPIDPCPEAPSAEEACLDGEPVGELEISAGHQPIETADSRPLEFLCDLRANRAMFAWPTVIRCLVSRSIPKAATVPDS